LVPPSEIHGVFISHIFTSLLTLTTRGICKTKTHKHHFAETGQHSRVDEKFITLCPFREKFLLFVSKCKI
jgi:hypothetical protein